MIELSKKQIRRILASLKVLGLEKYAKRNFSRGIHSYAMQTTIKDTASKLIFQLHPDKNPGKHCDSGEFTLIKEARDYLKSHFTQHETQEFEDSDFFSDISGAPPRDNHNHDSGDGQDDNDWSDVSDSTGEGVGKDWHDPDDDLPLDPKTILKLDYFSVFASILYATSSMTVMTFVKFRETLDSCNTTKVVSEFSSINKFASSLLIAIFYYSVGIRDVPLPVEMNDSDGEFLQNLPTSKFVKLIWNNYSEIDPDVGNPNSNPASIFGDTVSYVVTLLLGVAKPDQIGVHTFDKIMRFLQFIEILRKSFLFRQFPQPLQKKIMDQIAEGNRISNNRPQYTTKLHEDNNEFPQFSPGGVLVAIVVVHGNYMKLKLRNMNSREVGSVSNFTLKVQNSESLIGRFTGQALGNEDFFEKGNDPDGKVYVPYLGKLPMKIVRRESAVFCAHRSDRPWSPIAVYQHITSDFAQAVYECVNDEEHFIEDDLYTYDTIMRIHNRTHYGGIHHKQLSKNKQYKINAKRKREDEENSKTGYIYYYSVFDDLVPLMGDRVSKLLPHRSISRSMGGFEKRSKRHFGVF